MACSPKLFCELTISTLRSSDKLDCSKWIFSLSWRKSLISGAYFLKSSWKNLLGQDLNIPSDIPGFSILNLLIANRTSHLCRNSSSMTCLHYPIYPLSIQVLLLGPSSTSNLAFRIGSHGKSPFSTQLLEETIDRTYQKISHNHEELAVSVWLCQKLHPDSSTWRKAIIPIHFSAGFWLDS